MKLFLTALSFPENNLLIAHFFQILDKKYWPKLYKIQIVVNKKIYKPSFMHILTGMAVN